MDGERREKERETRLARWEGGEETGGRRGRRRRLGYTGGDVGEGTTEEASAEEASIEGEGDVREGSAAAEDGFVGTDADSAAPTPTSHELPAAGR